MKQLAVLLIIVVFLAGCVPQQQIPAVSDDDIIATYVAATLTAAPYYQDQPIQGANTETPGEGETPQPEVLPTETETPTPTLTLTPTITASPTIGSDDPTVSLGVPTFKDNFDTGSNFYLYDEAQSSYQVSDNQMVLIAKKANNYETWTLSWGDLKNFYLEITGTFGSDCSGKDRYGMIFRAPDTSEGYLISITCDGSYRLSKWESDAEEYTTLKKWTSSPHINSGPGGVNRLGIKAKDSKLTGFINGHQVFELNDGTFSKGRFGVLVAASDTPGFSAYLSQVVYWKLP